MGKGCRSFCVERHHAGKHEREHCRELPQACEHDEEGACDEGCRCARRGGQGDQPGCPQGGGQGQAPAASPLLSQCPSRLTRSTWLPINQVVDTVVASEVNGKVRARPVAAATSEESSLPIRVARWRAGAVLPVLEVEHVPAMRRLPCRSQQRDWGQCGASHHPERLSHSLALAAPTLPFWLFFLFFFGREGVNLRAYAGKCES